MINYAILRHFYIIYAKSNTNNGSRKLWILKLKVEFVGNLKNQTVFLYFHYFLFLYYEIQYSLDCPIVMCTKPISDNRKLE